MPFTRHRGQRIHYTVDGAGPLVVLQHGMLMDASSWRESGIVDALSDAYCVAAIDSLGHGLSDKPVDATLYDQAQRAGDIVAVIDDLGCDRAHLVGHSMGAWMAVGVAKYHPRRLASLILGGWDPLGGLPLGPRGPITFDHLIRFASVVAPELVQSVTPQSEPGLRACFAAMDDLQGAGQALRTRAFPLMLWCGRDEVLHAPMQALAIAEGVPFLSSAGDHIAAMLHPDKAARQGIRGFIDAARGRH
jgi:pimeloyl-ACP methyl ester carboxylesterase